MRGKTVETIRHRETQQPWGRRLPNGNLHKIKFNEKTFK